MEGFLIELSRDVSIISKLATRVFDVVCAPRPDLVRRPKGLLVFGQECEALGGSVPVKSN